MTDYIITFAGEGIRDGYLLVSAADEEIVRAWAAKEYGKCWSGVYLAKTFIAEKERIFKLGLLGRTTLHYEDASHVA